MFGIHTKWSSMLKANWVVRIKIYPTVWPFFGIKPDIVFCCKNYTYPTIPGVLAPIVWLLLYRQYTPDPHMTSSQLDPRALNCWWRAWYNFKQCSSINCHCFIHIMLHMIIYGKFTANLTCNRIGYGHASNRFTFSLMAKCELCRHAFYALRHR